MGSFKQKEDHQVVECLIGGTSIILDKHVASLLTDSNTGRPFLTIFQRHRLFGEDRPGCYRLIFLDKGIVFDLLSLDGKRRMGVGYLEKSLNYSAINPSGTFGGESFA